MYKKIDSFLSISRANRPDRRRHQSTVTHVRTSSRVRMGRRARAHSDVPTRTREVDHIRDGIRPRTEAGHKAVLRDVEDWVWHNAHQFNIPTAVVQQGGIIEMTPNMIQKYVEHRRLNPKGHLQKAGERTTCKWSHTRNVFNTLLAVLRDAERLHTRLRLAKKGNEISRIERSLNLKVQAEAVDFPRPATSDELWRAYAWLGTLDRRLAMETRIYLQLWWFTTARPGDALLLKWENVINMGRVGLHTVTAVKFVEGKGPTFRGPYTVHTVLPATCDLRLLKRESPFLFPESTRVEIAALALKALKIAHPENEMRSVRRGSLQELAIAGTPEAVLLNFSGHASAKTLHRYLDWGLFRGEAMEKGVQAVMTTWLGGGRSLPFTDRQWQWKIRERSIAGEELKDC